MTRQVLLILLGIICCCHSNQWLMEGDLITDDEANNRNLIIDSSNTTTSVSSVLLMTVTSPPKHKINCVIAAAIHLNGNVSLVDGGIGSSSVTLSYETLNGQSDFLYVMVQSNMVREEEVGEGVARNSRITIIYDKIREWKVNN